VKSFLSRISLAIFLCSPALVFGLQSAASDGSAQQPEEAPATNDQAPAATSHLAPAAIRGRIKLDVVVANKTGEPLSGLALEDFTILDNNQPQKILSFRAIDGPRLDAAVQTPRPPMEVILVLDTVNLDYRDVVYARQELEKFLRRNDGHLAEPMTVLLFSDTGLSMLGHTSADGNALATALDQRIARRVIGGQSGADGDLERFQLSLQAISSIADNRRTKPGRKLLVWVSGGWPMLDTPAFGQISQEDKQRYFAAIVSLSTRLRESRLTLYSVSAGVSDSYATHYLEFLKGVKSAKQAYPADMALKVLVVQSGGRVLGPTSDLVAQIDSCLTDTGAYYMLSFDPPRAGGANEYHDLKIQIDKPGLIAHTSTGYYDQP
jgi:VWFA-related protein